MENSSFPITYHIDFHEMNAIKNFALMKETGQLS